MFRVQSLGCRVQFWEVWGLGFGVWGVGCGVVGLRLRVEGSGFRF